MHHIDLSTLLQDALRLSGCSDEQIGSFDSHSTIELALDNLPPLNIGQVDNEVWFWSPVSETHPNFYLHREGALLRFVMQGFEFSRTGQLQLTEIDGTLQLRALLSEAACADAQSLAQALDNYLTQLIELHETLSA